MSQPTIYGFNPQEKATALLKQSRTQRFIGTITTCSRRGARKIQQVLLENGVTKINGQQTHLTFDCIATIHWQAA